MKAIIIAISFVLFASCAVQNHPTSNMVKNILDSMIDVAEIERGKEDYKRNYIIISIKRIEGEEKIDFYEGADYSMDLVFSNYVNDYYVLNEANKKYKYRNYEIVVENKLKGLDLKFMNPLTELSFKEEPSPGLLYENPAFNVSYNGKGKVVLIYPYHKAKLIRQKLIANGIKIDFISMNVYTEEEQEKMIKKTSLK